MAWYLDTSAFLKLAIQEPHSSELRAWAEAEEDRSGSLWSSDLLLTEAVRTARRVSTEALKATMDRLQRMAIVAITTDTYIRAGELDPAISAHLTHCISRPLLASVMILRGLPPMTPA